MERYEIRIKRSAAKQLEAISTKTDLRKVVAGIHALAHDPRPPGCEKLAGRDWYRVLYAVDDAARVVLIVKVGHRRDVYR